MLIFYLKCICSNRTLTAKFATLGVRNNTISVSEVIQSGSTGVKFQVNSDYPIESNIAIMFSSRGSYSIVTGNDDQGTRDVILDFEGSDITYTLTAGSSSWEFTYLPGIDSSGYLSEINWAITWTTFSDSSYNYKKGTSTGLERY